MDRTKHSSCSFVPLQDACIMLSIKHIDRKHISTPTLEMEDGPTKVYNIGSNKSIAGINEKSVEKEYPQVKGLEIEKETSDDTKMISKPSTLIDGLEIERTVGSGMHDNEKHQDKVSTDNIKQVQESPQVQELKDCFKVTNSTSKVVCTAQNVVSDTESETTSLIESPADEDEENPPIIKSQLPQEKSSKRGGLKRVYKYSKSMSTEEPTITEKKSVGFASISIRNYNVTLGDHPDCSYGPSVCLGWDYEDYTKINVEDYEVNRPERRTPRQMLMNYYHRKYILTEFAGVTETELKSAVKLKDKTKRQRNLTRALLPIMEVETAVESVKRKYKRRVKKSDTI